MKVSFQKEIINPTLPCHMEGYDDRISYELHDSLEINTLLIESNKTILFHVIDVILIEKKFSDKVKNTLSQKFSLPKDQIVIQATHTHSGPKVSKVLYPEILPSEEYLQLLLDVIIKNTEFCLNHRKEARAYFGTCEVNGYYCNRNDQSLPFNNQAYTLQFRDLSNNPLVSFINIACHPTILAKDNLLISSDYVGVLRDEYFKSTHVPAVVVNGECGDVSTRFTRQGEDFAEIERVGKGIANLLAATSNFKEISFDNLSVSSFTLNIDYEPKQDQFLIELEEKILNQLEKFKEGDMQSQLYKNSLLMLKEVQKKLNQERILLNPTGFLYETNDMRFVTIPGEIVYNLGKILRSQDEKPMFINAYSNEFNGYAVDRDQYGKYFESYITNYPYGRAEEMIEGLVRLFRI